MMQRCSSSHGNMMGACCCGMYHSQSNSFCGKYRAFDEEEIMYSSHSPTSVDCTLSLATPSTRRLTNDGKKRPSFGWNVILPSKHTSSTTTSAANNHRAGNGADPLLARRCANCDTTSTPLWRNGPRGPKSLCNACGIRFKKEERRAMAVSATTNEHATNNSWAIQPQKMGCHGNELRFIEEEQYYHREEYSASGIPFLSWRLNVTDMSHRPSLVHDFTR